MRLIYLGIATGITLSFCAEAVSAAPSITWVTYHDDQGTTLDYPKSIFSVEERETEAGAGKGFHSTDLRARLKLFNRDNQGQQPEAFMKSTFSFNGAVLDYVRATQTFFVVSGTRADEVFYTRCNLSKSLYHCFDVEYPKRGSKAWDAIVTRMSKSLRVDSPATLESSQADEFPFDRVALLEKLVTSVPGMGEIEFKPTKVPTVPCPASSMTGDASIPSLAPQVVLQIPPELSTSVAYYKGILPHGILGPRGWTCKQYDGSSGTTFLLAPTGDGVQLGERYEGPQVSLSFANGETSGRYEVADVSSVLFPSVADFVDSVRGESPSDSNAVDFKHDTYNYLSPTVVVFRTPPNVVGVGTRGTVPSNLAVTGIAYLSNTKGEPCLTLLQIRLDDKSHNLAHAILRQGIADDPSDH